MDQTDLIEKMKELTLSKTSSEESIAVIDSIIMFLEQKKFLPAEAVANLEKLKNGSDSELNDNALVTLTTNHKSKGREWAGVIIPSCTESNYPYLRDYELSIRATIEEERRLFYVAVTKAVNGVHIVTRNTDGIEDDKASPFINELNFRESGVIGGYLSDGKINDLKSWLDTNQVSEPSRRYLMHIGVI